MGTKLVHFLNIICKGGITFSRCSTKSGHSYCIFRSRPKSKLLTSAKNNGNKTPFLYNLIADPQRTDTFRCVYFMTA